MPAKKVVSIESGRARALAKRNALVEEHLPLVAAIARHVALALPDVFDLEDLESAGKLGLIDAAQRYFPGRHGGAPFKAYARLVIHGAIVDSVRRQHYLENTRPSITDAPETPVENLIETEIDAGRLRRKIKAAVDHLPARLRTVVRLHYGAELNFGDVARQVRTLDGGRREHITRGRAWQLHRDAIQMLRVRLRNVA